MILKYFNDHGLEYEGEVDFVSVPAEEGDVSALDGHTYFLTSLRKGAIKYKPTNASMITRKIDTGILEISDNVAMLTT